jgi:inner membrane protein
MTTKDSESFFNSLTFRGFLVTLLTLLLLIPLFMVGSIINERKLYYDSVIESNEAGWNADQTVVGPVLVVPYTERYSSVETATDSNGITNTISRDVITDKTLLILPENLNISAKLNEKKRNTGKFSSYVYQADVLLSGHFKLDALPKANNKYSIHWDKAWLSIGLTDTTSLNSAGPLRWQTSSARFEPGSKLQKLLKNGIHASMSGLSVDKESSEFKIELSFNGNSAFNFAPLGESTTAKIQSGWPNPDFIGDLLPTSKVISTEGFNATWRIQSLARNYPQSWIINLGDEQQKISYQFDTLTAGVNLFKADTTYDKIMYAANYGVIFIVITFLAFLIFDAKQKYNIHILHYVIIGLLLVLFYLLLTSLIEYFYFDKAYIYAAGSIIGLVTLYTFATLKSFSKGLFILILLSSLYAALYFILQSAEYALVASSVALLFVLVLLMLASYKLKYDD